MVDKIGKILERYNDGDNLSDAEILYVRDMIAAWLESGIADMGPRYSLFVHDLRLTHEAFVGYARHRGLK